ncbi:MAG: hypothetical protein IJB10_04175 [Clostridia bacterium]|nr:hypothetical protein [Clostridia bacterium]
MNDFVRTYIKYFKPSEAYNIEHSKEDLEYFSYLFKNINDLCIANDNNFASLCFFTYELKKLFERFAYNRVYLRVNEDKFSYGYDFNSIMKTFNIDKTQSSRIISCYEKFIIIENEQPIINPIFAEFSKSKLYELLAVDVQQLKTDLANKVLRPDMSVNTIRQYVKNIKALQNLDKAVNKEKTKEEVIDEEIPMAYNPKQHYDFEYFKNKTKNQLLNMIWDLQKEYEKLKGIKTKNG